MLIVNEKLSQQLNTDDFFMKYLKLILNSLRYYRRSHVGLLLGTVISTAVLVGALIIGDSVRYSLRVLTLNHIGKTETVITSGDRFFRSNISDSLESLISAPLLQSQGIAIAGGGQARVNNAQIYGIDSHFWKFANQESYRGKLKENEAILNKHIADRLGIKKGDTFLLRLNKPSAISSATPFSVDDKTKIAVHLKVADILDAKQFGDFSTRISQTAPLNIYLSLSSMGKLLEHEGSANLLLTASMSEQESAPIELAKIFKDNWQLEDAELELKYLPASKEIELTSHRVFLSQTESDIALSSGTNSKALFTYFVNAISASSNCTPYSFIAGILPDKIKDDEIIISEWLANDINAKIGNSISIKYFVAESLGRLRETNRYFRVSSIDAIAGSEITEQLTPNFPGLSDADSCGDWDTSLPIDLDRIRDKDEEYWNDYKATPKAFITLKAAQDIWQNQFGNATAIRFPANENSITNLTKELISKLEPTALGFQFIPIREKALSAGEKSVDFGQLFIGLSFFLIVAALMLTGMLFIFSIENRTDEIATLQSVGYPSRTIKTILMTEGFITAFIGAAAGTVGGIFYNQIVLYALGSVWRGAVGTSALQPCIIPSTLVIGLLIGLLTAVLSMRIALAKQFKYGINELRSGMTPTDKQQSRSFILNSSVAGISLIAAIAIMLLVPATEGMSSAGAFFGAGALLLINSIMICKLLLQYLYRSSSLKKITIHSLSLRNIARQQKRSLTSIAILASGIFLVIAVAANRKDPNSTTVNNSDGTGGFSLYGEFTIPFMNDLNAQEIRKEFGLDIQALAETEYVQIHAKKGDNASCLNLNHITNPRIISINPATLDARKSFTFTALMDGLDKKHPWLSSLGNSATRTNNTIPAVADMEVITWSLGKKIGDTISYIDDSGSEIKLQLVGGLANSIFQGSIIIAEDDFRKYFPSEIGTKILLIDQMRGQPKAITLAFEDYGLELVSSRQRLAKFNTIQNTYLSIFLILGGLGIILGTAGLGLVVARNINDRRQELGIMRAVGYKQKELYQLLLREHIMLLIAGVVCGSISGFLAVLPAIISAGGSIPYLMLAIILIAIIANGVLWISVATARAIKVNLFNALRRE